jgi:hypothetical protein
MESNDAAGNFQAMNFSPPDAVEPRHHNIHHDRLGAVVRQLYGLLSIGGFSQDVHIAGLFPGRAGPNG